MLLKVLAEYIPQTTMNKSCVTLRENIYQKQKLRKQNGQLNKFQKRFVMSNLILTPLLI